MRQNEKILEKESCQKIRKSEQAHFKSTVPHKLRFLAKLLHIPKRAKNYNKGTYVRLPVPQSLAAKERYRARRFGTVPSARTGAEKQELFGYIYLRSFITNKYGVYQGVTKRCRLSWLTNSVLVYEPNCGGGLHAMRGLGQ